MALSQAPSSQLVYLIPILVYMFVCLNLPSKYQLALSGLLSTGYALVMMAVIVGTALQLGEDGVASPSAVFLISMTGSFFIAACLHPQEFWCIVPGIIYLVRQSDQLIGGGDMTDI